MSKVGMFRAIVLMESILVSSSTILWLVIKFVEVFNHQAPPPKMLGLIVILSWAALLLTFAFTIMWEVFMSDDKKSRNKGGGKNPVARPQRYHTTLVSTRPKAKRRPLAKSKLRKAQ